ncbi:UPF0496 protein At1g20180 [Arachis hypogaea]|uniref:UPF0496 protein At1g20180 n=1 Tax=Arachis hypogaea TaxID=3818 RepID=UPI0010FC604C|nr:UPF0496 protein At1g20180 isoform X1 [Arachis hypogaea]
MEASQGTKKSRGDDQININFHEEYLRALKTKSYADCFNKAQLLATQSSINYSHKTFLEFLLEPDQETIPSLVDSATISMTLELRNLMLSYFDISAEASHICTSLLKKPIGVVVLMSLWIKLVMLVVCQNRKLKGILIMVRGYCSALNKIQPGAVPKVVEAPSDFFVYFFLECLGLSMQKVTLLL